MKSYLIEKRLKELCTKGHLTNDQNNLLMDEYRQDKEKGICPEDSVARALLILGNHKLVLHTIKTKFNAMDMFDADLVSVGKIGLVKAIDTFNQDKKIELSSYAVGCIRYEIFNYYRGLRAKHQTPNQQSFIEDYINEQEESQNRFKHLTVLDTLQDDEDVAKVVHDKCMVEAVEKNIKYLSRNEALSVMHSYGLLGYPELTCAEIGRKLNLTHSSIVRYNANGLKKLKVLISPDKELTVEERQLKQRTLKAGISNDLFAEQSE